MIKRASLFPGVPMPRIFTEYGIVYALSASVRGHNGLREEGYAMTLSAQELSPTGAEISVLDVAGEKVGTLSENHEEEGYLFVRAGVFFPHQLYVPIGAVLQHDENAITLRYTREEISDLHWDAPPQGQPWYSSPLANAEFNAGSLGITGIDANSADFEQHPDESRGI